MIKQGKGLMKQLLQSNKREYTPLSIDYIIHFYAAQVAYDRLNKLKISIDENIRLRDMIGSNDYENLTIAELIMDQYEKR